MTPQSTSVRFKDSLNEPPKVLLAVDPGKVSGVAIFIEGNARTLDQVSFDDFGAYLFDLNPRPDLIVYENYRLFSWKAKEQSGSKMEASQIIGMLKLFASSQKIKIVEQGPQIKPIAQKWSKTIPPKNHANSHQIDAFNHGFYYLVFHNMRGITL